MFYEKRKNDLFVTTRDKNGHLGCGAHMHYHLELVWMTGGTSMAFLGEEEHVLVPDSLFLSFPNQSHAYRSHEVESFTIMIVNPSVMPTLSTCFDTMVPEDPVLTNVSSYPELQFLLEAIRREEQTKRDNLTSSKLRGLMQAMFSELFRHMPLRHHVQGDSGVLKEIINYCAVNFDKELSLSLLAEELHMSKYYISHLFNSRMKVKFNDYINSLRVSAACRYLSSTDKSVTEISELAGFNTPRTFNRAFLKQFGKSPSEYRAENTVAVANDRKRTMVN